MRKTVPVVVAAGALVALLPMAPMTKPASAFALGVHEDLTAEALPFLGQGVLADIKDEHLYVDTRHQFDPAQHFDSCTFSSGANHINAQYLRPGGSSEKGVVAEFQAGAGRALAATDEFGQLLHPAQDFYAHSNWVEMGRRDLLDDSLSTWPSLAAWTQVRPGVLVTGPQLPSNWTASNAGNPLLPTVTNHTGQTAKALISGTTPWDNGQCLGSIAHGHWGSPGLHKDDASRSLFAEARALGVRQTQHEWCRMLHLTKGSGGDFAATSIPMGLWVKPNGNPHPANTKCANPERGGYDVTIAMKKVKVLDDEDPLADGEINLNLAGYLKDFKDSARKHVGPLDLGSGESVPAEPLSTMRTTLSCVRSPQDVVATLQGWDDDLGNDGVLEEIPGDPDDLLSGITVPTPAGLGTSTVSAVSGNLDVTFEFTRTHSSHCSA